jgi:hypothetical protein
MKTQTKTEVDARINTQQQRAAAEAEKPLQTQGRTQKTNKK